MSNLVHLTIIRKRCGNGHTYTDRNSGKRIKERSRILKLKKLGVPPGYPTAYLTENMNEKILAIGIDARGRSQYMYNQSHKDEARKDKYEKLYLFGKKLPTLIRSINHELENPNNSNYVAALIIKLISVSYFRIGCNKYAAENYSYGVTTLLRNHIRFSKNKSVIINFPGKHGVINRYTVIESKNPHLYRYLLSKRNIPRNESLFPSETQSSVNAFLSDFGSFSSKYFRTWNASKICLMNLSLSPDPLNLSVKDRRIHVKNAIRKTAEKLHHTESICKSSYICPAVIHLYTEQPAVWNKLNMRYKNKNMNRFLLEVVKYYNSTST